MQRPAAPVAVLALALGLFACTSSQQRSINASVARNTVAVAGAKQFKDTGHPLEGLLDCTTRSKSATSVDVTCTGKTKNGEAVTLTGTTADARQLKGAFIGTVAGQQVFKTSCLGC
ncbi:MAG: hypothetical protein JWL73_1474 [Actinomycetia bacterium]|nr:hypothetical protein [Actinomycetes bacterium]